MVVGQPPMMLASALPAPPQLSNMVLPGTAQGYIPVEGTEFLPHTVPMLPPSQSSSTSPTYVAPAPCCNVVPSNNGTIFTYPAPVPTNYYQVPCNMTDKPPDHHIYTSVQSVPFNPHGIYTCPPPPPPVVPCQPGMVNGAVVPCALCVPNSPPPMYRCTPPPMYRCTPPPSMSFAQTIARNVVTSWKQSYGMEHFWTELFNRHFFMFSHHRWTILPVAEKPGGLWYQNVDSAKVRFCCDTCGHGWTSMKGRVVFWFILNPASCEGVVCLKLFGQRCNQCQRDEFETAMWYPEEVEKVIKNIYNKVGQVYYGFVQAPYLRSRRAGKPRTPHNSTLCQACQDGVCTERR